MSRRGLHSRLRAFEIYLCSLLAAIDKGITHEVAALHTQIVGVNPPGLGHPPAGATAPSNVR
ncbi:MAG: hypothetical protein NTX09_19830 [Verrucomicrobia bacterium]|nr:hypothetical protein [Verrucomicrobiota bacterium]